MCFPNRHHQYQGKRLKHHTAISEWVDPMTTMLHQGFLEDICRPVVEHPEHRDIQMIGFQALALFAKRSDQVWVPVFRRHAVLERVTAALDHQR